MNKNKNLVDGEVLPTLVKFTIPILLSLLLQIAYGTADLFIVGQFSDVYNVSGVSIGSQLTQVFTAFCVGLSMGTTILIGRNIGAKKNDEAAKVVGVSIFAFVFLAIICSAFILTFASQLTALMQAPAESFNEAKGYLMITGTGAIFIVFYNLLGSIFKGIGDSKTPLVTVSIACITNIVFDLILVGGFNMGANGAAIATVFAQGVSVLLSLVVIRKNGLPFDFELSFIKYDRDYIAQILRLGIPSALQMGLTSCSFMVISAILNSLGVAVSAAVGIVGKITAMILVVPQSFMQSMSSFTAQNYGAGKIERAYKGLKCAILISLCYGIVTGYLSFFHGEIFTNLFNPDADTAVAALSYLKAYSADCVLVVFVFSLAGFFNGCGRTTYVMLQGIMGALLIRVPFSYWFSTFENVTLFQIGLAVPLSTAVQLVVGTMYFMHVKKTIEKNKL